MYLELLATEQNRAQQEQVGVARQVSWEEDEPGMFQHVIASASHDVMGEMLVPCCSSCLPCAGEAAGPLPGLPG